MSQAHFNERAEITLEVQTVGLPTAQAQIQGLELRFNKAMTVANAFFGMLRRAGLGEEYDIIVQRIMHLIMLLYMLRTAMLLLEAGTPYGAAMGGITGAIAIGGLLMGGLELLSEIKGNMS